MSRWWMAHDRVSTSADSGLEPSSSSSMRPAPLGNSLVKPSLKRPVFGVASTRGTTYHPLERQLRMLQGAAGNRAVAALVGLRLQRVGENDRPGGPDLDATAGPLEEADVASTTDPEVVAALRLRGRPSPGVPAYTHLSAGAAPSVPPPALPRRHPIQPSDNPPEAGSVVDTIIERAGAEWRVGQELPPERSEFVRSVLERDGLTRRGRSGGRAPLTAGNLRVFERAAQRHAIYTDGPQVVVGRGGIPTRWSVLFPNGAVYDVHLTQGTDIRLGWEQNAVEVRLRSGPSAPSGGWPSRLDSPPRRPGPGTPPAPTQSGGGSAARPPQSLRSQVVAGSESQSSYRPAAQSRTAPAGPEQPASPGNRRGALAGVPSRATRPPGRLVRLTGVLNGVGAVVGVAGMVLQALDFAEAMSDPEAVLTTTGRFIHPRDLPLGATIRDREGHVGTVVPAFDGHHRLSWSHLEI